jgi:iron complex transport system substrate-binding protein
LRAVFFIFPFVSIFKNSGGKKEKMKTKNKMLILMEIAIVVCSVLLVAIPGIAAEQTRQEVSVSEVTTASEDDYVLGIYGNANEDDTIDMRDLTYVKLIFFGERPETELADAKYDAEINPLDFVQIKLIIVGKEKELTLVDTADRIVTVKKPVERVVWMNIYSADVPQMFGIEDKIVGVGDYIKEEGVRFPEHSKLSSVGRSPPDYEMILSLNPGVYMTYGGRRYTLEHANKLPGVTVVGMYFYKPDILVEELEKLGYIFGKKDEVKRYIDNFHDKYMGLIKERTKRLSEEEKPKVMVVYGDKVSGAKSGTHQQIEECCGRNVFADVSESSVEIDPEEVIKRNPDVILRKIRATDVGGSGYHSDDTSRLKEMWEEITNRPEWSNVSAVKNRRVYITHLDLSYGLSDPVAMIYWAKWFHPDLFEDMDPQTIHQEFIDEFLSIDFNVYEHGVFVYHPEQHPDGR